jgi:hypothetical protein
MIPNYVLRSIEQMCSQIVCPECGGHHQVTLEDVGGTGAVKVSCSQDACDAFKGAAQNLVHAELRRFVSNPFSFRP